MRVVVTNLTPFNQFVDLDGKANTDDIIHLGPKNRVEVNIPTEKRFVQLSKDFLNKMSFRKV